MMVQQLIRENGVEATEKFVQEDYVMGENEA